MRNSGGLRILPWGTVDTTGNRFQKQLFIVKNWYGLDKYDLNQQQSLSVIAHDHNLERIRL